MNSKLTYRNIAYIGGLLLIVGLFINFTDPIKKGLFDLLYDLTALTTFTFAYLWLNKRILYIGLILYILEFNIDLVFNPVIHIDNTEYLTPTLMTIGNLFHLLGFVCLILGLWDKFENKYLTKAIDFGLRMTLTTIIILTGIIQAVLRSI